MLSYTGSMEETIVRDDIRRFPLWQRQLSDVRDVPEMTRDSYHAYIKLAAQASKFALVNVCARLRRNKNRELII